MASQGEGSRSHHRKVPRRPVRTPSLSPQLTAGSASQQVSPRLIRSDPYPQLTLDVRPRARPRARPSRDPNPNVTFNTRMVLTPPISQPVPRHADQAAGQTRGRHARRIHRQDITRRLERSTRMVRWISEPRRGWCQHDRNRSAPPPNDKPNLAADSQRTHTRSNDASSSR